MAEWSKALASGASPQGRGFEPHSCQCLRRAPALSRLERSTDSAVHDWHAPLASASVATACTQWGWSALDMCECCSMPLEPCHCWFCCELKCNHRTRACNLWFRRPTPYPLGHRAHAISCRDHCPPLQEDSLGATDGPLGPVDEGLPTPTHQPTNPCNQPTHPTNQPTDPSNQPTHHTDTHIGLIFRSRFIDS